MIYLGKTRVAGYSPSIESAIDKIPIGPEGTQGDNYIQGEYNRYYDTKTNLIINQLTEELYKNALLADIIKDNELYMIEEGEGARAIVDKDSLPAATNQLYNFIRIGDLLYYTIKSGASVSFALAGCSLLPTVELLAMFNGSSGEWEFIGDTLKGTVTFSGDTAIVTGTSFNSDTWII